MKHTSLLLFALSACGGDVLLPREPATQNQQEVYKGTNLYYGIKQAQRKASPVLFSFHIMDECKNGLVASIKLTDIVKDSILYGPKKMEGEKYKESLTVECVAGHPICFEAEDSKNSWGPWCTDCKDTSRSLSLPCEPSSN